MTEATQSSTQRGARPGNRNALRHGIFTREAIEERRRAREAAQGVPKAGQTPDQQEGALQFPKS